jgi:RimJ/RimL family protein N-acetyltransferase
MIYNEAINGNLIDIRSVNENDAEFILKLRTNEKLSKYINKTENNIEKQKIWIKKQLKKEGDFYFIALDNDENPMGLASIYNIDNNDMAEFGRWISKGNQIQNLEMVVLLHDLAFFNLGIKELYYVIVKENKKVINFWKRFGAEQKLEYNNGIFDIIQYNLKKENYIKIRENQINLLSKFY